MRHSIKFAFDAIGMLKHEMLPSEQILSNIFRQNYEIYKKIIRLYFIHLLAEIIASKIRITSNIKVEPFYSDTNSNIILSKLLSDINAQTHITQLLVENKEFQERSKMAFQGVVGLPSKKQQCKILLKVVSTELASPSTLDELNSINEKEVYPRVGQILSSRVFALGDKTSQVVLWNYSLLIFYMYRWRTPYDRLPNALNILNLGYLGVRGNLLSITSRHGTIPTQIDETLGDNFFPSIVEKDKLVIPCCVVKYSHVLKIVALEFAKINKSDGFYTRALRKTRLENKLAQTLTPDQQQLAENGRNLTDPLYEYTALLFMELSAIDFLLRCYTPKNDLAPDTDILSVIKTFPSFIQAVLEPIYSRDQWNIRNRCMHGSYLETGARLDDIIRQAGVVKSFGIPLIDLSDDGSLPKNAANVVAEGLEVLASYCNTLKYSPNIQWTSHYLLTAQEMSKIGIMDWAGASWSAEKTYSLLHERDKVKKFLNIMTPCLHIPLEMGITCWTMKEGGLTDKVPRFYFLVLMLEPLLRLCLHIRGCNILQVSQSKNKKFLSVQYKMMDQNGLLCPSNMALLLNGVEIKKRAEANETLHLAVKCRNALAHGAIYNFDQKLIDVYSYSVVKAVHILIECCQREYRLESLWRKLMGYDKSE